MELMDTIEKRKSYRAFDPVDITDDMISEMMYAASRAPSCSNNQPWRFIFVRKKEVLDGLKDSLSEGNYWGLRASMIIALISRPDLDCQIDERNYNLLDSGMAMGLMLLKATEMGLATHPIAGFDQDLAKKILEIPADYQLLPLILVGRKSENPLLLKKEYHRESEKKRSERKPMEDVMAWDMFDFND